MKAPPRLWHRFFRWFCHPDLLPGVEGDLMELYNERLAESGKRTADRRFIIDVLQLFRLGIIRPVEGSYHLNSYGMLKNYLKVAVRNILKYKAFSFINVFGLAAAMSVCMLIILMLADQNSYDRFHPKKDRIYRILSDSENFKQAYATSPFPLAEALRTDYPTVENATHLMPGVGGDATYSERAFEMRGYFAEPAFFEVFGFDLKAGNESIALAEPNSIVISSRVAAHLFGDENPVGKVVDFADRKLAFPLDYGASGAPSDPWGSFTVTGVVDGDAYRSHLKFDVLMSASTRQRLYTENKIENLSDNWSHYWQCYTYVLLDETKTLAELQTSLADVVARKYKDITSEEVKGIRFEGQQLADVAMGLANNDTNQRLPGFGYYFLGLLASVVLVCACLNYTSLSIARATTRAREIGVRKTNGANRGNLVAQFLSESILTSLLALVIALVLLVFLKTGFMNLWINKHFNFDLQANLSVYLAFIVFAVMIGLVAGAYPAFYMAAYKPVQALKNTVAGGRGKMGFKKALGITQFVISLLFIVTSILIFRQFNHYMNFQYGFASENIVNIQLQGNNYQLLAAELSAVPGVASVSACDVIPSGGVNNNTSIRHAGSEDDFTRFGALNADHQFIETIGVKLLAGRQLPPSGELPNKYVLVNEAAVKAMGFQHPSDMVGAVFETEWDREPKEVIGVVADFRFKLLINEDKIAPLMVSNQTEAFEYLNVKLASKDVMGTVSQLEARWKSIDPVHPFKYQFFDEQLAATHQAFFDIVTILGCMAFLSILIACLGLLGMATYSTERRTKEVGIRKALGAAESSIAILLSREFLGMLLIAIGIAAPLSYFLNNLWLQNLPNRVEFGFGTVAMASGMLLVLGLVTIGSQTLRASRRNPVDALKSE